MGIWAQKSNESISRIKRHWSKCLIVHYSCQSLYDDREGLSPRISTIVVRDLDSEQTFSFAIHLTAESMRIAREEIVNRYDEIESRLLDDFYNFVRDHTGNIWLHWNMINMQYGFETLAHRYFVLTEKNAPNIDMDNRVNISSVLQGRYGENFVDKPHMVSLMKINGGIKRDFVSGKEEVELFKNGEFARLHASTIAKVAFFAEVCHLLVDGKVKTSRAGIVVKIERILDHWAAKAIGVVASLYTLINLFSLDKIITDALVKAF